MTTILLSDTFRAWLAGLRDHRVKARVAARIRAAGLGRLGDVKPVGAGIFEMRISYGPGYRVYYVRRGEVTYLLLCGGDKSSQIRDIQRARDMAAKLDGSA
ncbi:type II toxin-antitoxin system RelE/ParE family toxin [Methylobacterium sp. E-065]|uniref:type II toxin-antitoxin system RelE/ParE family toxin n=1 Tax=Methylobacterium sp. E-065 TaxID=2836583 RepID=UPI001FBA62D2|nr:type II toxin-antitoxin system RelE/ParE family toxin [Methylobacterium sp. E-065]MCJ2020308.1 type II toxin-antitoxin system RelE/ParE family toxin [Methylobacterium sp. E-065]